MAPFSYASPKTVGRDEQDGFNRPCLSNPGSDGRVMRMALLCGGLERGRDGVGDYCRRLAGQLARQGIPSVAVALNDSYVSGVGTESQEMEGSSISVLRLPTNAPWGKRITACRNWLETFDPDWISLQFVPFAFHPKGLCFRLGRNLRRMNAKASWHLMFHELWLGLGEQSSVKHRVWGAMQRLITKDLVVRLRPRVVHTQAEPHRVALEREGIAASILPLFGNIPFSNGDGWKGLLEPLVTQAAGRQIDRSELYMAGMLGRVPPEWSLERAIDTLLPLVDRFQRRLTFVFLGKDHLTPQARHSLAAAAGNRAHIVFAGERTDLEISEILQSLDLGVAVTPRQMIQKSGSAVAMLEHGLRVLVTRDDWRLPGLESPLKGEPTGLLSPKQFGSLEALPLRNTQARATNRVKEIAELMLAGCNCSAK